MMSLKQTGIPASEYDAMKTNWYRYYWQELIANNKSNIALAIK